MIILRSKLFAKKECEVPDEYTMAKIENRVKEDYHKTPKSKREAVAKDTLDKIDSEGTYHSDGKKPEGKKLPKKTKDKIMKEVKKSGQLKIEFEKS